MKSEHILGSDDKHPNDPPVKEGGKDEDAEDAEGQNVEDVGQEHLPFTVQTVLTLLVADGSQGRDWGGNTIHITVRLGLGCFSSIHPKHKTVFKTKISQKVLAPPGHPGILLGEVMDNYNFKLKSAESAECLQIR